MHLTYLAAGPPYRQAAERLETSPSGGSKISAVVLEVTPILTHFEPSLVKMIRVVQ